LPSVIFAGGTFEEDYFSRKFGPPPLLNLSFASLFAGAANNLQQQQPETTN
jgi:hypothetical protein